MKKFTQEEFINKCKSKFGDLYDYSLVKYTGINNKITLICKIHGEFQIIASNHLNNNRGCQQCGFKTNAEHRAMTTEIFIEKAKLVHGDRYDYRETVYIGGNTQVKIFCKSCEVYFEQLPQNHLAGHNHMDCRGRKAKTTEEFIAQAKVIHGEKYSYDKVEYINSKTNVLIYCNIHKKYFSQQPNNHLCGKGCQECGILNTNHGKLSIEDFVDRANAKHGDKFDYSQVDYQGWDIEIEIFCKEGNHFYWQRAGVHLLGGACTVCSTLGAGRLPNEIFLQRAKDEYGEGQYEYPDLNYKRLCDKIDIICLKCGKKFTAIASEHMHGDWGCKCRRESKGERKIRNFLDKNNIYYDREKIFHNCVGITGQKLKFDFYIPSKNLCIEYDGEGHYLSIQNFGGDDALVGVQMRDIIKDNYCRNNGLSLLRISYFNLDNINLILSDIFNPI